MFIDKMEQGALERIAGLPSYRSISNSYAKYLEIGRLIRLENKVIYRGKTARSVKKNNVRSAIFLCMDEARNGPGRRAVRTHFIYLAELYFCGRVDARAVRGGRRQASKMGIFSAV